MHGYPFWLLALPRVAPFGYVAGQMAMSQARSGTHAARYDQGLRLRQKTSRQKHADLLGSPDRDPVAILAAGDRTRVPELVPVRYERMLANPFAFLRGAAAVMAEDLRHQPADRKSTRLN